MEAALILSQRGFDVILFEKKDHLGGQLYLASLPPHKEKMANFIHYCETQLRKNKADIRLNTEVSADEIRAMNPYAVIIATGSVPVLPRGIRGIDNPNVYTPEEVLTGKAGLKNKNVVVAGAGVTGMETSAFLAAAGNKVTDIDMLSSCGEGAFSLIVMDETASLAKYGVRTMPNHRLLEIKEDRVILEDLAGVQIEVLCDAVVMSLGVRSSNPLQKELADLKNVTVIGEAEHAGRRIPQAVHPAFEAACHL